MQPPGEKTITAEASAVAGCANVCLGAGFAADLLQNLLKNDLARPPAPPRRRLVQGPRATTDASSFECRRSRLDD